MKTAWPELLILLGVAASIAAIFAVLLWRGLLPKRLILAGLAMFLIAGAVLIFVLVTRP